MDLRRRGAEELMRSGHLDEGRAVADEALADAGMRVREVAGAGAAGRRAGGAVPARAPVPAPQRRGDRAPRAGARRSLLVDLVGAGADGSRAGRALPGAQLAAGAGGRRALSRFARHRRRSGLRRRAGERPRARRSCWPRRRPSRPSSITRTRPGSSSLMSGLAAHLGGRFASALEHLATAERIFRDRCVGAAWELNAVRHFTLECFYYLGALERFRAVGGRGAEGSARARLGLRRDHACASAWPTPCGCWATIRRGRGTRRARRWPPGRRRATTSSTGTS